MEGLATGDSDIRARDLLPLPTGGTLKSLLAGAAPALSQSQRRRRRRQRVDDAWLMDGIASLNRLGCAPGAAAGPVPTAAQVAAVKDLAASYGAVGRPLLTCHPRERFRRSVVAVAATLTKPPGS